MVGRETAFVCRSFPARVEHHSETPQSVGCMETTALALEPVIGGGKPRRDVKPSVPSLTVLKKYVYTA
jgi:hypothetical protein